MEVTKRLVEAGKIIGIDLLDHIVLVDGEYCSLTEKGFIERSRKDDLFGLVYRTLKKTFNIEFKREDIGYEAHEFYHEELDNLLIPVKHLEKLPNIII